FGRAFEGFAVGQRAGGVDVEIAILGAKRADGVVVLEREAERVHAGMAVSTGDVGPVLLHALAERAGQRALIVVQLGHVRWRGRRRCTQQLFEHPTATLDRRRPRRVGRDRQHAGLGEDAAALAVGQADALELIAAQPIPPALRERLARRLRWLLAGAVAI